METLEDNVLSHKLDRLVGKTEQGRGQVPGSWSHEKLLSTGSSQCQNHVGSSGHCRQVSDPGPVHSHVSFTPARVPASRMDQSLISRSSEMLSMIL